MLCKNNSNEIYFSCSSLSLKHQTGFILIVRQIFMLENSWKYFFYFYNGLFQVLLDAFDQQTRYRVYRSGNICVEYVSTAMLGLFPCWWLLPQTIWRRTQWRWWLMFAFQLSVLLNIVWFSFLKMYILCIKQSCFKVVICKLNKFVLNCFLKMY